MTLKSVLLDSNVWINIWQGNNPSKDLLLFLIKRKYILVIPEHVLSELTRKIQQNKGKILDWFLKFHPTEIRFLHDQENIKLEASKLSNSYQFCHYPDNRLLASCKENMFVLITNDRKLLMSANFEGVLACTPKDFTRLYA